MGAVYRRSCVLRYDDKIRKEDEKMLKRIKKGTLARVMMCLLVFGLALPVGSVCFGKGIVVHASEIDVTPAPSTQSMKEQMDGVTQGTDIGKLGDSIKPVESDMTRMVTDPVSKGFNGIMWILLNAINIYFFVQTCLDVFFLIAPGFRDWLSGKQGESGGTGKTARFCNKLISEAALNAVGYKKSEGDKGHIQANDLAPEVDWKGWITKRLFMFICIMTYVALLMMGMLGDVVNFFSRFGYSLIDSAFKLLDPDWKATPSPSPAMISNNILSQLRNLF